MQGRRRAREVKCKGGEVKGRGEVQGGEVQGGEVKCRGVEGSRVEQGADKSSLTDSHECGNTEVYSH